VRDYCQLIVRRFLDNDAASLSIVCLQMRMCMCCRMRAVPAFLVLCAACSASPVWHRPQLSDQSTLVHVMGDNGGFGPASDMAVVGETDADDRNLHPHTPQYPHAARNLGDLRLNVFLLRQGILSKLRGPQVGKRAGKDYPRWRKAGTTKVFRWGR
jgi:hypothetical protein